MIVYKRMYTGVDGHCYYFLVVLMNVVIFIIMMNIGTEMINNAPIRNIFYDSLFHSLLSE